MEKIPKPSGLAEPDRPAASVAARAARTGQDQNAADQAARNRHKPNSAITARIHALEGNTRILVMFYVREYRHKRMSRAVLRFNLLDLDLRPSFVYTILLSETGR